MLLVVLIVLYFIVYILFQVKDMVEQAVGVLAQENMELACVFIQKTAVEKALIEIDKRLAGEYEVQHPLCHHPNQIPPLLVGIPICTSKN